VVVGGGGGWAEWTSIHLRDVTAACGFTLSMNLLTSCCPRPLSIALGAQLWRVVLVAVARHRAHLAAPHDLTTDVPHKAEQWKLPASSSAAPWATGLRGGRCTHYLGSR